VFLENYKLNQGDMKVRQVKYSIRNQSWFVF